MEKKKQKEGKKGVGNNEEKQVYIAKRQNEI